MQVKIQSLHFTADLKLEEFIEDKLSKLNNRYDQIISAEVTLRLEKSATRENKITEIRLMIPGNDLFAKKQSKTFEESTDQAIDALKIQIKKRKKRVKPA
jgi:putative sigma-54 modulation protein